MGSSAAQIWSPNAIASGGVKWQYIAIIATFSSLNFFFIKRIFTFFTRTWLRCIPVFAIANPSVVCNVRAPYPGIETFGNISPPFSTASIQWPPCKILRISSQANISVRGVKRKRGIATYVTFGHICGSWASCFFLCWTFYPNAWLH